MKLASDPSQQKLAVPLVLVLVVAVTVTVVRLRAPSGPAVVRRAASAQPERESLASPRGGSVSTPATSGSSMPGGQVMARNPFAIPPASLFHKNSEKEQAGALATGSPSESQMSDERPAALGTSGGRPLKPVTFPGVSGLSVQRPMASSSASSPSPASSSDEGSGAPPSFELGAVISGPRGKVAVIKQGGKEPVMTVSEGQVIDGGYRVARIGDGQVFLRKPGSMISLALPQAGTAPDGPGDAPR